jgi:tetratricopeptide (TPR) repeat protein
VSGAGVVMLLLVPASMAAEVPPDLDVLREAESAFHDGVRSRERPTEARQAFARAAERYEELRRRGAANAALFRDAGDAYLLAGDLSRALLAYRRGQRLSPNDAVLRGRLDHARAQVAHPQPGKFGRPPSEILPPWVPRVPSGAVLFLALLLYGLGCFSLTRWWMLRPRRLLTAGCLALAGALLLGAVLGVREYARRQEARHPLVVIADEGVLLRRGNGLSYPPRYETPVNRGVEARLLFERGDWLKVELAGGESGWVPRRYALLDAEPSP